MHGALARCFLQSQIVHGAFLYLSQFLHVVCFRAEGHTQYFRINFSSEEFGAVFSVLFQIDHDSLQVLFAKDFFFIKSSIFHRYIIEKLLQSETQCCT